MAEESQETEYSPDTRQRQREARAEREVHDACEAARVEATQREGELRARRLLLLGRRAWLLGGLLLGVALVAPLVGKLVAPVAEPVAQPVAEPVAEPVEEPTYWERVVADLATAQCCSFRYGAANLYMTIS